MSKGITLAEECHIVNHIPPIDINGAGATGDWLNVKNASHVTFLLTLGVTGAASTVTVEEADSNSGGNSAAIAFDYYAEETAAGDTLGDRTDATTSGFSSSTNNSITYVIEVDAAQLTDGKPYLAVKLSDPTSATLASCVAVLSGIRYAQENTATAIT